MDYLFFQAAAVNGFDSFGHYLRAGLIVNQCSTYAVRRRRAARRTSAARRREHGGAAASPCRATPCSPGPRACCRGSIPTRRRSAPQGRPRRRAVQRRSAARGKRPRRRPARRHAASRRRPGAGRPAGAHRDAAPPQPQAPAATPQPAAPAPTATPGTGRRRAGDPVEPLLDYLFGGDELMGGRGSGIAGNPVLIGAATVLVVLVAVFLSYNANQGLPFVPTYQLEAETPSAANLVRGNEVRIGGTRVGSVDEIGVERRDDGTSIAVLGLKLERSVDPLPKDSTVLIRPRSALGLKYVELTRGTSDEGFDDGDTIPLAQATPGARRVRRVHQHVRRGHARGGAARTSRASATRSPAAAASINQAIGAFRPLLRDIIPVAQNLSSAETNLPRFVSSLAATPRASSRPPPRARRSCSSASTRTFAALRDVARPYLQESISEGPETLDAAIDRAAAPAAVPRQHRGRCSASCGRACARCAAPRPTSPTRSRSARRRCSARPPFNRRLASLLTELRAVRRGPARAARRAPPDRHGALARPDAALPRAGADDLQLRRALVPQHRLAAVRGRPERHLAALHHHRHAAGPEQRGRPVLGARDGPTLENHLHSNPYPNTAAPGQPRECEAGNEPYLQGRTVTGNVPGTQQAATEGKP